MKVHEDNYSTLALNNKFKPTNIDEQILQKMMMQQYNTYKHGGIIEKSVGDMTYRNDFAQFYGATENIYNSAGSGTLGTSQSLQELNFLSRQRMGVGNAITQGVSEDALFNWHDPKKIDSKHTLVTVPGLKKWEKDTNFKSQAIAWNTDKRIFGIGFLVKFWSSRDVRNGMISKPAPRTPPKKFQVLSPLYLAPVNTHDTRMLDYDEDVWLFQGGNLRVSSIHKSRVEVLRGPLQTGTYRGLSVIEPVYLSIICLYNILIYLTRGVSKYGSRIPVMKSGGPTPTPEEYTKFLALMTEYVMNNFFFIGKEDEIQFPATNLGAGMFEIAELFKEDICSGTRIPLNELFGRSEGAGISGAGVITAQQKYANGLANEQLKISDDLIRIYTQAGFDFEDKDLKWNVAIQKTPEQQLTEERMELENEMLKKQIWNSKMRC
jgi:hypothetical protein